MQNIVTGEITTVDMHGTRHLSLDSITGMKALLGARLVFVTTPDIPHIRMRLYRMLFEPRRTRKQIVVLVRAGQGGQVVVADILRRHPRPELDVVLVEDAFYGTRVSGDAVRFKRKKSVNVSVYGYTAHGTVDEIRKLFPLGSRIGRRSWPDIVERPGIGLLFDPLGYIIHAGVAFAPKNLERTRRGVQYLHYIDGISQELAEQLDSLDRERVALAARYGASTSRFPEILERQYGIPARDSFFDMMQSCRGIYQSLSAPSIEDLCASRYVQEDIPALTTVAWLAERAGMDLRETLSFATNIRITLRDLGVDERAVRGYRPSLNEIQGGVAELRDLVTQPVGAQAEVEAASSTGR